MKRQSKIKWFSALIVFMFSTLVFSVISTIAWYYDLANQDVNMTAQVHGSYFESGDGSVESPFEIHTPMQLYYFSWLQSMGYFNEVQDGTTELKQYHFYLSADLDLTGIVLPPIGTSEYPFIGTFTGEDIEGNVHSVSNLVISNSSSSLTDIPVDVDSFTAPEIVGFFGVVGSLDGDKQNTVNGRYNDVATAGYTYDTSVISISDFYINGCTIRTQTENALIGIVAGYANGPMSGVGVVSSNIYVKAGTSPLSQFSAISSYSIVGYATDSFVTELETDPTTETVEVDSGTTEKVAIDDAGNAWGGSIDMYSIYNRCKNVAQSSKAQTRTQATYVKSRTYEYDINGEQIGDATEVTDTIYNYPFSSGYGSKNNTDGRYYDSKGADGSYCMFKVTPDTDRQGFCLGGMCNVEMYTEIKIYHTSTEEGFKIGDGSGNYLNLNSSNDGVTSGTSLANATIWAYKDGTIYSQLPSPDCGIVYLNRTNQSLSISSSSTTSWTVTNILNESNEISCSIDGKQFYIVNNSGTWQLIRKDGYYLTDGTNYVYASSSSALSNTTSKSSASVFYFSGTTNSYIETYYNNTLEYLYFDSSNASNPIQISTGNTQTSTKHYQWNITDDGIYYDSTHYIIYKNSAWTCGAVSSTTTKTGYYIISNSYYMTLASNSSFQSSVTSQSNATLWTVSNNKIYYQNDDGTTVYLKHTYNYDWNRTCSLGLTTSDSDNTWTISGLGGSTTISYKTMGVTNYLNCSNGTWSLTTTNTKVTTTSGSKTITTTYSKAKKISTDSLNTVLTLTGQSFDKLQKTTKETPGGYNSYIPINALESGEFTVKDGNTGYIMSGSNETTQNYRSDIRVTSWNKSNLGDSLDDSNKIDDANVYTYDDSGNHKIDTSNFVKYASAKVNYQNNLDNNDTYVYGLHFMDASISKDRTFRAAEVVINNERYQNYEMPIDCIDFNLESQGYVNFFGGSYFTNNNCFFSLHEIFRDAQLNIADIKEIEQIFVADDVTEPFCYKYKNDDNYYINQSSIGTSLPSGKNYTVKFKTSWVTNPTLTSSQMYYYEIPMNPGEYALGSVSGRTGAYLNYLDIAANKQYVDRMTKSTQTVETTNSYSYVNGVAFVENVGDEVNPEKSATYSLGNGYSSSSEAGTNYEKTGNTITVTPNDNVQLEFVGSEISSNPSTSNPTKTTYSTTTSLKKEDYYKSQNCNIVTIIDFTDVKTKRNGVMSEVDRTITVTHYRLPVNGNFNPTEGGDEVKLLSYRIEHFDGINNAFNYSYYLDSSTLGLSIQLKTAMDIKITYLSTSPYSIKINNAAITGTASEGSPIVHNIAAWSDPFTSLFGYPDVENN